MNTGTNSFQQALTYVKAALDCGALHDWAVYEDAQRMRHIVVLPAEGEWDEIFDEGDASE